MSRAASPVEQSGRQPLVWLLMGTRTGDNNQLLALAETLGYPFETKRLTFNQLRRFPFLRRGLTILDPSSRGLIAPPWPDLAICVGYGSVPVARFIRQQSGGRTRLVHIGNPRTELDDFDLRITTPNMHAAQPPTCSPCRYRSETRQGRLSRLGGSSIGSRDTRVRGGWWRSAARRVTGGSTTTRSPMQSTPSHRKNRRAA